MQRLPQQLDWDMAQNRWAAILNPMLSSPILSGQLLPNISITTGSNIINHRLGRKLQGWIVVGNNGLVQLYDTQASNQTPQLTLLLTSDADVTISLWVF